ncbi:double-strand break repair protein AddB [Psychromarinibacter halotolerans]|uniref:Double-strand break repair protein AddB n=1 Tax=Psychromarinibacter halotolerans TaxID=1775175 RepID=A0ABV7GPM4_9RHOB|nr:double-strand break repair protein AddB [Psychromarinibacter halotolerans]MDF0595846.1 double-strand break repair protein AddB [Psychromarinibacter halotolerans]
MFDPSSGPRIFGLPPGADFPRAVVEGLLARTAGQPPEALARAEIFVNTRRMQRRMKELFDNGPARLLPRIRLVTDLATEAAFADIPPAVPPLRRRLELTQLVAALLERQPDLAPRASLFDLADSLAALMDEMQGEGVPPDRIASLDVADQSGHWQRSLSFVTLVEEFLRDDHDAPDAEARQRRVVDATVRRWANTPPAHPVIVAGSTGSRGATATFMRAVAALPQGALILPGFDFDLPSPVWDMLDDALASEDHPQFRFSKLLADMESHHSDVRDWQPGSAPNPPRNRLLSLALRPAPVTDQWMNEGQGLAGVMPEATADVTMIEAQSSRAEAGAIALVLRDAAERGKTAALITPDRVLSRQVTAALDRWGITPDDSAGRPLPLTAPGRFLRHVAALVGEKLTSEALLTLLKHPLTNSGSDQRGPHLLHTRELELKLRRWGPPFPTAADLLDWAAKGDESRIAWATWLAGCIAGLEDIGTRTLTDHLDAHIALSERLAAGPLGEGSGELWLKEAGGEALRWVEALRQEASHGGRLTPRDYQSLFLAVLQRGEVREATGTHPGIMIWGTLEARVQGADVVVLGGLNEGVWPEAARPDPWLNRTMRHQAGLLLPERRIGLAAHDFQQAAAAPEVVITRAVRDAEAQTVPSRWLNRLINLMAGLSDESAAALAEMRGRGNHWLALAERLDAPTPEMIAANPPARRPAPSPPVDARPKELSITEIQTLIRDPYAVYARRVLGLSRLDPLRQQPDAPLRGTVLHELLDRFIASGPVDDLDAARARLFELTDAVLEEHAPWPAAQRMWRARVARFADWFLSTEAERQSTREVAALEHKGGLELPHLDLLLKGKIDRVDRLPDGRLAIYDYKTGNPPTKAVQDNFDKQLGLAAVMAERGAIADLPAAEVGEISYIGLGSTPKVESRAWSAGETAEIYEGFVRLITAYRSRDRGYVSRRAVDKQRNEMPYDHLARFGEWDESDEAPRQEVGE